MRRWTDRLQAVRHAIEQRATTRRLLITILGTYILLCLGWSLATPPYEASDETSHIAYVEQVAHGSLPVLPSQNAEAAQPPGYYLLEAALVNLLHLPPPPRVESIVDPRTVRPLFGHSGESPFLGGALAVRVMRVMSTGFGLLTLVLTYLILCRLLPPPWALSGLALVAFIPQYTFFTSVVDNDALSYAAGAAVCLAGVALVTAEDRNRQRLLIIAMGASLGAMFWAKEYAFALLPLVPIALALARVGWRRIVGGSVAAWITSALVASPVFVRNLVLYNTPWPFTAQRLNLARLIPSLVHSQSPLDTWMWTQLPAGVFSSLWFKGGWGQIVWPAAVYWALAVIVVPLTVVGAMSMLSRATLVPVAALGLLYAGTFWSALTLLQAPGRYLFPAVAGVGALLMLGMSRITRTRFARLVQVTAPLVVVVLNLYALGTMIAVLD